MTTLIILALGFVLGFIAGAVIFAGIYERAKRAASIARLRRME